MFYFNFQARMFIRIPFIEVLLSKVSNFQSISNNHEMTFRSRTALQRFIDQILNFRNCSPKVSTNRGPYSSPHWIRSAGSAFTLWSRRATPTWRHFRSEPRKKGDQSSATKPRSPIKPSGTPTNQLPVFLRIKFPPAAYLKFFQRKIKTKKKWSVVQMKLNWKLTSHRRNRESRELKEGRIEPFMHRRGLTGDRFTDQWLLNPIW